jgi:hypothetical protein
MAPPSKSTETKVSSESFAEPLGAWVAARMPARLFGAAAALIVADSARDRVEHPDRYLPRCASTAPFKAAVAASAAINLALVALLGGPGALLGLLALNIAFLAWYRLPPQRRSGWPATLALLVKYPAFAALLAPAPLNPLLLALACAGVYAAVCVHEWRTA